MTPIQLRVQSREHEILLTQIRRVEVWSSHYITYAAECPVDYMHTIRRSEENQGRRDEPWIPFPFDLMPFLTLRIAAWYQS